MSLYIYLMGESVTTDCECIDCGHKHSRTSREKLFRANITHNLSLMASEAGLYLPLWHPENLMSHKAKDLIPEVEKVLQSLLLSPEFYKTFNDENGWGVYEHFVSFVERCLEAFKEFPEATVETST
jgi:hypothetical protein